MARQENSVENPNKDDVKILQSPILKKKRVGDNTTDTS